MILRTLVPTLKRAAKEYPAVVVTGPRQSGKTTLVRHAFPKYAYVSLELPDELEFARSDPRGFLEQFTGRVILDEVQRAPFLFSYIQSMVDERKKPGQFILSGSQNFLLLQSVSQSLAGRVAILHLLPFSLSELEGRKAVPMATWGTKALPKKHVSKRNVWDIVFQGGYPRMHEGRTAPKNWHRNYYQTYAEKDVRTVINVGDLESFGRFVRMCAARAGQLLNLSSLASDCGISHTSAKRWLSVLEASFLVFLLRPHYRNFGKRMIKSPKLYFYDSGLLCYLLRIRDPEELRLHALKGHIFESFVISELMKNAFNRGEDPALYFWRDAKGHELDVLIDRGSALLPIEIKAGQTIASDYFKGLSYWRELNKRPDGPAALIYAGQQSYKREGVQVYSWQGL